MIRFVSSKNKYFDFKVGILGGVIMGIIVFLVNYLPTDELVNSFTASIKQAIYTFFFGGTIMKLCETLALRIKPQFTAILLATVIPSLTAISLTFGLHSLKGTPLPFESTIPTAILIFPSTLIWAIKHRKNSIQSKKNPG